MHGRVSRGGGSQSQEWSRKIVAMGMGRGGHVICRSSSGLPFPSCLACFLPDADFHH